MVDEAGAGSISIGELKARLFNASGICAVCFFTERVSVSARITRNRKYKARGACRALNAFQASPGGGTYRSGAMHACRINVLTTKTAQKWTKIVLTAKEASYPNHCFTECPCALRARILIRALTPELLSSFRRYRTRRCRLWVGEGSTEICLMTQKFTRHLYHVVFYGTIMLLPIHAHNRR